MLVNYIKGLINVMYFVITFYFLTNLPTWKQVILWSLIFATIMSLINFSIFKMKLRYLFLCFTPLIAFLLYTTFYLLF